MKTWVIIVTGLGPFWLSQKGAEAAKHAVADTSSPTQLDINGRLVNSRAITSIVKGQDYIGSCKLRQMSWKCANDGIHKPSEGCDCPDPSAPQLALDESRHPPADFDDSYPAPLARQLLDMTAEEIEEHRVGRQYLYCPECKFEVPDAESIKKKGKTCHNSPNCGYTPMPLFQIHKNDK